MLFKPLRLYILVGVDISQSDSKSLETFTGFFCVFVFLFCAIKTTDSVAEISRILWKISLEFFFCYHIITLDVQ